MYSSNEQILADISVLKIEKCKQETVTVVHFIKLTIEWVIIPGGDCHGSQEVEFPVRKSFFRSGSEVPGQRGL